MANRHSKLRTWREIVALYADAGRGQAAHGEPDANDQYALGVALYQALTGVGRSRRLRRATPAPRRILRVAARAFATDPAARWPSMAAFVGALLRASRPRWPYAVLGAALVAGALAVVLELRASDARAAACAALPVDLVAAWNPAVRRALIANNPQATTSAAWLADVIDHHAAVWPAQRRAVCVTGSAARFDDAARCLAARRDDITGAARDARRSADDLVAAARALHDPRGCGELARGDEPGAPRDGDAIAAIDRTLARVRDQPDPRYLIDYAGALADKARLQARAGQPGDAIATGRSALVVLERIWGAEHAQLIDVLRTIGGAERERGQLTDALATLERARRIADAQPAVRAALDGELAALRTAIATVARH